MDRFGIQFSWLVLISMISFGESIWAAAENSDLEYLGTTTAEELAPKRNPHRQYKLSAGLQTAKRKYREDLVRPKRSDENGNLSGIRAEGEWRFDEEPETAGLRGRYEYLGGMLRYDGSLQTETGEYAGEAQSLTATKTHDLQLVYLQPLIANVDGPKTEFFIGVGHHSWDRDIREKGGYRIQYKWPYVPVGYRAILFNEVPWLFQVEGGMKFIFDGRARVGFSKVDEEYSDLDLPLGSGFGARIEAHLEHHLESGWAVRLAPWYEKLKISRGSPVDLHRNGAPIEDGNGNRVVAHEPASETETFGAALNLTQSF